MYSDAVKAGGLAVVTGAASGVGRVAAIRFAQAGLGVVLADLPGPQLDEAVAEVGSHAAANARVFGQPTDVTCDADVAALADAAFAAGPVAVLMNNAGIGGRFTAPWEDMDNWHAILDVNFTGVLRGVQAFLPRMIAANRPAAVISTGSKQGITCPPGNAAYNVSKTAVKALTEQVAHGLREAGVPISAHLFVPGFTFTGITGVAEKPAAAWTAAQCVDHFLGRMERGDFYILCPDNDVDAERDRRRITWALGDIIENRPALSRWHPDHAEAFKAFEQAGRD